MTILRIVALILFLLGCDSSQQGLSRSTHVDKKVRALIEKMVTNAEAQHRAFAELEAMGCAAVPSIIERMDDRRELPDPNISLRNKSRQAFEGLRHYGPKKVVDALAAILNQITGQDFGFIYNGGTEAERAETVRGWHDYLKRTPATELCK